MRTIRKARGLSQGSPRLQLRPRPLLPRRNRARGEEPEPDQHHPDRGGAWGGGGGVVRDGVNGIEIKCCPAATS